MAISYFFGRQYTAAVVSYFGVEVSALGMTADEYIVRSADAMFLPIGVLSSAALLAIFAHVRLVLPLLGNLASRLDATAGNGAGRGARLALQLAGSTLAAYGVLARFFDLGIESHYLPSILAIIGVALVGYGEYFRDVLRLPSSATDGLIYWNDRPRLATAARLFLVAFVALNVFFAVSSYAQDVGRRRADLIAETLSVGPRAIVYSASDLSLRGPGITADEIAPPESKYRYRYSGLRLLSLSGSNYLFLPIEWKRGQGAAIILQASDEVRIEFER